MSGSKANNKYERLDDMLKNIGVTEKALRDVIVEDMGAECMDMYGTIWLNEESVREEVKQKYAHFVNAHSAGNGASLEEKQAEHVRAMRRSMGLSEK